MSPTKISFVRSPSRSVARFDLPLVYATALLIHRPQSQRLRTAIHTLDQHGASDRLLFVSSRLQPTFVTRACGQLVYSGILGYLPYIATCVQVDIDQLTATTCCALFLAFTGLHNFESHFFFSLVLIIPLRYAACLADRF